MTGYISKPLFAAGLFVTVFAALLSRAPSVSSFLISPDSGYQLGLGSQILHGKYPYGDLIFHYGPLVAYISALGQWLSGNVIAEVILCSLGYTLALCLIFFITLRYSTIYWSAIATIAGYLLLARFYKWYYWLFPLAVLYMMSLLQDSRANSKDHRRYLFLTGGIAGIATLFRFELGIVFFCFFIAWQMLEHYGKLSPPIGFWKNLGSYLCGFVLIFGTWLIILFHQGGSAGILMYFYAIFSGGSGVVQHWAISIPSFDWSAPLSPQSAAAAIFTFLPVFYLCTLVFCLRSMLITSNSPQRQKEHLFLAAVAIMGLGIYPQGYYRADPLHALQIISPALAAIPLFVHQFWKSPVFRWRSSRYENIPNRVVIILFLAWSSIACTGLLPYGGYDLSKFSAKGLNSLQQLGHPLEDQELTPRAASLQALMKAVVSETGPDDPILVIPLLPQIYFLTQRPMSGLLIGYARGIHDTPFWQNKAMAAVRKNPPRLVVAPADFWEMEKDAPFRASHPELYRFLSSNYQNTIYQQGGLLILAGTEQ